MPARLQQQHAVSAGGSQAIGEHAARAPGADDDIVEGIRVHRCPFLGLETTLFGAASESGRPAPHAGAQCAWTEELTESVAYFRKLDLVERLRYGRVRAQRH
jgi:hypothetical protein